MKPNRARSLILISAALLAPIVPLGNAFAAQSDATAPGSPASCSTARESSFPKASLSNGAVDAVVYLPDPKNGYYRASRFDWSGVIPCLTYKGHSYFGMWFSHYDPLVNDSITGPVEEFRSAEIALGYDSAKPGELFFKPGVGVLRRVNDSPYRYGFTYPLVDPGTWTSHSKGSSVTMTQHLKSTLGYAYVYEKTVKLDKHQPILILEHKMKNTGTKTIDTEVYDHDFYMIDGTPTGPDMSVRFAFTPKAERSMEPFAKIEDKKIVYLQELPDHPRKSATSFITGYSDKVADYDIFTENEKTGAGVEQTSDSPISHFNFWSIHTTLCPEAYIHINIAPGQTARWTIRYRFYAK